MNIKESFTLAYKKPLFWLIHLGTVILLAWLSAVFTRLSISGMDENLLALPLSILTLSIGLGVTLFIIPPILYYNKRIALGLSTDSWFAVGGKQLRFRQLGVNITISILMMPMFLISFALGYALPNAVPAFRIITNTVSMLYYFAGTIIQYILIVIVSSETDFMTGLKLLPKYFFAMFKKTYIPLILLFMVSVVPSIIGLFIHSGFSLMDYTVSLEILDYLGKVIESFLFSWIIIQGFASYNDMRVVEEEIPTIIEVNDEEI